MEALRYPPFGVPQSLRPPYKPAIRLVDACKSDKLPRGDWKPGQLAVDTISSLLKSTSTHMACRVFLIGLACAVLAGCDRSKPADTVVRGQILYRGEPVSGGLIAFAPNPERGSDGPVLTATLQADGSFTLTGSDGKQVTAGWYRIAVAPRAGTIELPTAAQPYPGLPQKFRNPALSGLEYEIKAGAESVICFDLDDS